MRRRRVIALLLIAIGVGTLACEWSWGQSVEGIYRYMCYISVLLIVILCGLELRLFNAKFPSNILNSLILLISLSIMVILAEKLHTSPSDVPFGRYIALIYYTFILSVICGAIGFQIGRFRQDTYIIFNTTAKAIAILTIYAYYIGEPGEFGETKFPSPYVGFPFFLFSIFSVCWFLYGLLRERTIFGRTSLWLIASLIPVLVNFHKPIIFSVLVSTFVLIAIDAVTKGNTIKTIWKTISLSIIVAAIYFGANVISHGQTEDTYVNKFYNNFLHISRGDNIRLDYDFINSASGKRVDIWQGNIRTFLESPLVGTGFGQTTSAEGYTASGGFIPVHNGFIDLLLSVGILGFMLLLVGLAWWLRTTMKPVIRQPDLRFLQPVVAYVFGIMAYNLGGTSRLFHFLTIFVAFCMGLASGHVYPIRSKLTVNGSISTTSRLSRR